MENEHKSLRKVLLSIFTGMILLSAGGMVFLDTYYYQYSPREPRPAEGRIYPKNVHHGAHVYLTRGEELMPSLLAISFALWFGTALYFGMRWKLIDLAPKTQSSSVPIIIKRKKKESD